jgi:methyl-accepting chemotaxis protein
MILALQSHTIRKKLICSFLGLTAAFLLSNSVLKPLEGIRQGMRDISAGKGDLTARLQVRSQDEVGQLSSDFNRFVGNVQSFVTQVIAISGSIAS